MRIVAFAALIAASPLVPAAPAAAGRIEAHVEQRDGAPLAEAVVAAYPLAPRALPPPADAIMDQHDRKFVPRVVAVQRGARVRFTNSDTVSHHVYSFSAAKRFQLFLEKDRGMAQTVEFDRAGIVTLGCNLHDWMLGYVAVVDTAWFGTSGGDGAVVLERLPAGRYRIELWHPRSTDDAERLRVEVDVPAEGVVPWRLRLERPLLPSRAQEPAFQEYGGG